MPPRSKLSKMKKYMIYYSGNLHAVVQLSHLRTLGGRWHLALASTVPRPCSASWACLCTPRFRPRFPLTPPSGSLFATPTFVALPSTRCAWRLQKNLNTDSDTFWAVHSPGQYAVPGSSKMQASGSALPSEWSRPSACRRSFGVLQAIFLP